MNPIDIMTRAVFVGSFASAMVLAVPVETGAAECECDSLKPFAFFRPIPDWLRAERRGWQGCPSIAVAPRTGRLWVAWMVSEKTEDDSNAVLVATSEDGGRNWSEPLFAVDCPGPLRTLDPGLWTDPDGKVWLFWGQTYSFWDGRCGLWTSQAEDPDDPKTAWGAPRRLCDGYMKNKPTVLANGDWLFPVEFMPEDRPREGEMKVLRDNVGPHAHPELGGGERVMSVYRSRDKGSSLDYLGRSAVPPKQRCYPEHMIVERKDGSLLMWGRTKYGIGRATSADGGKTWTDMTEFEVKNPNTRFHLRRLRSGALLLVKNGAIDNQKMRPRDRITAFVSDDDGKTWTGGLVLDERKNTSYPDMIETADGFIHVVTDRDRHKAREIWHHVFTEADVRAGRIVTQGSRLKVLVNKSGPVAKAGEGASK